MKNLFLTGANRGIGLALVKEALSRDYRIFAGCRQPQKAVELQTLAASHPDRVIPIAIDVTDLRSIDDAVDDVLEFTDEIDLLINNAGIFPRGESIENIDPVTMLHTFHVNSVGPMMVVQAMMRLLQTSVEAKILNISSQLGSITLNMSNHYSYNSSKAALNMLTRILASELRPEGILAVVVHPGWVQTDMGGSAAPLKPAESARGILTLAERLRMTESGEFFTWDGRKHPW